MPSDYSSPLIPDRSDDGGFMDPRMMRRLTAQLQARDERERMARLSQAGYARFDAAGPEPQPIQSSPRGTFPVMQGEAASSRPATMMAPSRSSYDTMSPQEQFNSTADASLRGALASIPAAALTGGLAGTALGRGAYAAMSPGWGAAFSAPPSSAVTMFGALGPSALAGRASDKLAGSMYPTSPTAGRFTPGPRVQEELESSYFPEQPWTRRMGISGEALAPASIEAAGERVAARRAQERAAEDEAIAARKQETNAYWSQLAEEARQTRAAEAARQRRLEDTFGTAEGRARQIMQLEASRLRGNGR